MQRIRTKVLMNSYLKDKRGEENLVTREGITLLVAAFCIIGLLYLGFLIYGTFSDPQELVQAKASLGKIVELEKGVVAGKSEVYLIESPKGWYLMSALKNQVSGCSSDNCICFCKYQGKAHTAVSGEGFDCKDEAKTCMKSEAFWKFEGKDGMNYILIEKVPNEIKIEKQKDGLVHVSIT